MFEIKFSKELIILLKDLVHEELTGIKLNKTYKNIDLDYAKHTENQEEIKRVDTELKELEHKESLLNKFLKKIDKYI